MSNKARQIIEIDFWQREMPPLELQQSESSGRRLEFQIYNYGEIFDITGYTAKFQAVRPDGQPYEGPCEIVTPAEGRFDYVVTADAVSVNGQMRGQIVFTNADGTSVRSRVILINVLESLDPDQKIIDTTVFAEARKNLMKAAEIKAEWDAMVEEERAILEGIRDEYANVTETVNTHKAESQAARDAAQAAQAEAEESARLASVSEGNAGVSETNAKTSETNAKTSETAAKASENTAAEKLSAVETIRDGIVTEEEARQAAEQQRVTAEQGRVNAENARVEAETARANQASADHSTAVADHEKYLSDQSEYDNLKLTIAGFEGGQIAADVAQIQAKLDTIEEGADKTDLTGYATEQFVTEQVQAVDVSGQLVDYVKKEAGKGLSTNDYTDGDKAKIDAIPTDPKYTDTITTINGKTGAITKDDVVALGIPSQDTKYSVATITADGLMSSGDKSKLEGVEAGANKTTVINALNSDSATSALSAAQGKALDGNIQQLRTDLTPVMAPQETAGKPIDAKYMFDYVTAMNAVLETI